MYRIAILEHEPGWAGQLEGDCRTTLENLHAEYNITCYAGGAELLAAYSEAVAGYDFLLLDVAMPSGGMEVARQLRQHGVKDTLVFFGENGDFALQAYDVRARHYLLKADYQQRLAQLIAEDWQRCCKGEYFVFANGSQRCRALLTDIRYLEIENRKIIVHLPQQRLVQEGKLSELLARLPGHSFVRCHQGYAVNLHHVRELRHRELILDNDLMLPVSRTYYKGISQAFMNWYMVKTEQQG